MKNTKYKILLNKIVTTFFILITCGILIYFNISIFVFKVTAILLFFIFNIILYFKESTLFKKPTYLESTINPNIKKYFDTLVGLGSMYGLYLSVKSNNRESHEKLIRDTLKRTEEARAASSETIIQLQDGKNKLTAENLSIVELMKNTHSDILKIRQLGLKAQETISNGKPEDANETLRSVSVEIKKIINATNVFQIDHDKSIRENESNESVPEDKDIHKSSFLSDIFEKYENLDNLGKLCVSLLFLNSALVSSLISLIFIFYGDYLIERFKIEQTFPRLATIIKLRKKFNKYYLAINLLTIFLILFSEIAFSVAILSL